MLFQFEEMFKKKIGIAHGVSDGRWLGKWLGAGSGSMAGDVARKMWPGRQTDSQSVRQTEAHIESG